MKTTANYGLKKPEGNDTVNIDDLNYNADIVDKKIKAVETDITDLKKHVGNGKDALYAAITGKKITPKSKDFDDLVKGIKDIKLGQGNAQASEVLQGKTFTNDTGIIQTGTMKNRGNLLVDSTVNDKDYGQGYFNNVRIKGLKNESNDYINSIVKELLNCNTVKLPLKNIATGVVDQDNRDKTLTIKGLNFSPKIVILRNVSNDCSIVKGHCHVDASLFDFSTTKEFQQQKYLLEKINGFCNILNVLYGKETGASNFSKTELLNDGFIHTYIVGLSISKTYWIALG